VRATLIVLVRKGADPVGFGQAGRHRRRHCGRRLSAVEQVTPRSASAIAVAISGAAFAKDLKGSVMTDSEMDKVTAGEGFGIGTAFDNNGQRTPWSFGISTATTNSGDNPGHGVCTTGASGRC
jgi:hypothetical protein